MGTQKFCYSHLCYIVSLIIKHSGLRIILLTKHAEQRDTVGLTVQSVIFVLVLNIIAFERNLMARCLVFLLVCGSSWV